MSFFFERCRAGGFRVAPFMFTSLFLAAVSFVGLAGAVEHDRPAGQPYVLSGKRVIFTSWYFIRPGQPDWQDETGKSLYASKTTHDPAVLRYAYEDRPYGIRLVAEPARRLGPIIPWDRPWEAKGIRAGTLLYDEGKYRLWAGCQDAAGQSFGCYFESLDGKSWQRPELGLVEYNDSKANNLLPVRTTSVFKDPVAPEQERYKSVRHGSFSPEQFEQYKKTRPWSVLATEMDPGKVHAILGAVSPDGLHWTQLPDPIGVEPSDTQVIAYYDERLNKYVMYTRTYLLGPRAEGFSPPPPEMYQLLARRAIGRTESADFRQFEPARTILEPGPEVPPTDQYYTNCRTSIPGAPDHHVFFPTVFHLDSDTTSVELYASYDGRLLHRIPGPPVLRTADYGQWDGGCIFAQPNLVELPDGSWALPYTGFPDPHKYPHGGATYNVGLAVWPKGRLVALEAQGEGAFTTPAILAAGTKLRINAVTKRVGYIRIEAANLSGKAIPGRSFQEAAPIKGDYFWGPVKWETTDNLGVQENEPVVLRFRMKMARLYGLEFE